MRARLPMTLNHHRAGFTLLGMMFTFLVALCLLAGYVRALDEAESLGELMRGDDTVRFARAGNGSQSHVTTTSPIASDETAGSNVSEHLEVQPGDVGPESVLSEDGQSIDHPPVSSMPQP